MFDKIPDNLPVEDILEKVDKAPAGAAAPSAPSQPRPVMPPPRPMSSPLRPVPPPAEQTAPLEPPRGGSRRVFTFVLLSLLIVGVFVGGGAILLKIMGDRETAEPEAAAPAVVNAPLAEAEPEPEAAPITNPPANVPLPTPITPALRDSDGDGLNDAQEISIGTDAAIEDTDSDDLSDFEEVRTWESDPLNPDTDGDGYTDGAEVKNGYLPTGPGKIIVTP